MVILKRLLLTRWRNIKERNDKCFPSCANSDSVDVGVRNCGINSLHDPRLKWLLSNE